MHQSRLVGGCDPCLSFVGWDGVRVVRIARFADGVGAVEPFAKVDHLAAFTAKWSIASIFEMFDGEPFFASWAFERWHKLAR